MGNPADNCSRGLNMKQNSYVKVWFYGQIFCNHVMARSSIASLKFTSIPRLGPTAATVAIKIAVQLKEELDVEIHEEGF